MIIVDASIAMKWLNQSEGEDDRNVALSLYEKHISQEERIGIPHFLFLEVANVLATKPQYSEEDITDGLHFLFRSDFLAYHIVKEDIFDAATLSKKYHTSVYDMLYAVIAKRNNCLLI